MAVSVQACCVLCTVQVLGKSVKPIPVMILGVLLAHKKYPWLKYLFVLMITTGVAVFMYKPSKAKAVSDTSSMFGWGELLLVCAKKFTVNCSIYMCRQLAEIVDLITVT